MKYVGSG